MRIAGTVLALVLCCTAATPAAASPYEYWIFALSWSPEYCKANLTSKEPQCVDKNAFVPADLRPHVSGPDSACGTDEQVPKELIDRMIATMKNAVSIKQAWKKSGACSGMPMSQYFLELERAGRLVNVPAAFREMDEDYVSTPGGIKDEFVKVNDGLTPGAMVLDCSGRYVRSVRFCLDSNFAFKACGIDLQEECRDEQRIRRFNSKFKRQR